MPPIPVDRVTALIKRSETRKLAKWKKSYYEKVARALQVHTKGQLFTKVDTLFPYEHPDSKAHCLATYEPITQSSIMKGINNLKRTYARTSVSYNVGEELANYLATYRIEGQDLISYFIERWVEKAVGEDPNGVFVTYPPDYAEEQGMCPIQFVRSELIHSEGEATADGPAYFAFISERDSEVEYKYQYQTTKREIFEDVALGQMNARSRTETTYNQRLEIKVIKAVIHIVTEDGIVVYEQKAKGGNYDYTVLEFPEEQTEVPAFPGGGIVADEADTRLYNSFVSPFIPFGNLALLQHRNHRAVDLQFSYPRMSELQMPCEYAGCVAGKVKCAKTDAYPSGFMPCPNNCTQGWITVQSPYKTYTPRYDPQDENKNEHLKQPPVQFFAPDVGIIDYSKDAWKNYLRMAEEAIFIQQKVQTGNVESAESKSYDFEEMYAWLTTVSKRLYNNVQAVLQALENYLSSSPVTVEVETPYSFAILTEEEAFDGLTKILGSNAPVYIKADRMDSFLGKFVSKDSPVARISKILKQVDLLMFYSSQEVQQMKAQNAVSQDQVAIHALAYPTLVRMLERDPALFSDQTDEQIVTALEAELKTQLPAPPTDDFRRTLSDQLRLPAGEGATP